MSSSDTVELSSAFPNPPSFYKHYSSQVLARLFEQDDRSVDVPETSEYSADNPNSIFSDSPDPVRIFAEEINDHVYVNPPRIPKEFTLPGCKVPQFGTEYQIDHELKSLKDMGVEQLYPDGPVNRRLVLLSLNEQLLTSFMDLVRLLGQGTEKDDIQHEYTGKLSKIRVLLVNMHHLINECRPYQARHMIQQILQRQIDERQAAIDDIKQSMELVQKQIRSLRV